MGTENNAIILTVVICFVAAALGSFAVFMLVSSAKAESRKLYRAAEKIVGEEMLDWSIRNPYTMERGASAPSARRLMIALQAVSEKNKQQSVFDAQRPITIGRGNRCQIILYDARISEQHACIFCEKGKVWIRNLTGRSVIQLRQGLFSRRIVRPGKTCMLHNGDRIEMNQNVLKVRLFVYGRDHR